MQVEDGLKGMIEGRKEKYGAAISPDHSGKIHGNEHVVVKNTREIGAYIVIVVAGLGVIYSMLSSAWVSSEEKANMRCNVGFIFSLGIDPKNPGMSAMEFFRFIGPFANEIANVLTITAPVDIYPHHTINFIQSVEKTLIDTIALMAIAHNVAYYASHIGPSSGVYKGKLLLLFSFIIPNLFMYEWLSDNRDRSFANPKLYLGLLIIYVLDVGINTMWCLVVGNEHIDHHDDEHHEEEHHDDADAHTSSTHTEEGDEEHLLVRVK